jgi:DNA repair protein RadC
MQTALHTGSMAARYGDDVIALALRVLEERIRAPGHLCQSPQTTYDYLRLALGSEDREVFMALFLDGQYRVISAEVLFRGTLTQTAVHPREVARAALRLNAAAVILAHNHPSGNAAPSAADISLTVKLKATLELIDVGVLDHLIIAGNQVYSLASSALMNGGDPAHALALPGLSAPTRKARTVSKRPRRTN